MREAATTIVAMKEVMMADKTVEKVVVVISGKVWIVCGHRENGI